MKQRRVGTLTMGVVLVLLGALLLFSQGKGNVSTTFILKGWPIILIFLGCEVLWFTYSQRDENTRLFYDIFSIFMIGLICITSLGLYGLRETGVISQINNMMLNQSFVLNTEEQKHIIDESIKKIIVESSSCDIKVRTNSENAVMIYGNAYIDAESKDKAEEMLKAQHVFFRKYGDVLYISFDIPVSGNMRMNEYNIILPENVAVDIDNTSNLKLQDINLGANWQIHNSNRVEAKLGENADVKITAAVRKTEDLAGNVKWQVKDGAFKEDEVYSTWGEFICGDGKYNLNVMSKGRVSVNQL